MKEGRQELDQSGRLTQATFMEVSRQALDYAAKPSEFLLHCYHQFVRQTPEPPVDVEGGNLVMLWRRDLDRLRGYAQHRRGCAVRCRECGYVRVSGQHRDGWVPGSGVFWHDYQPKGPCDCGLSAFFGEMEAATNV